MKPDFPFLARRYVAIENDLVDILDYIEITSKNFGDFCYKIGSRKLMDFCLKVGSEVESVFRYKLESSEFDQIAGITQKRKDQNINVYREVIGETYKLGDFELIVEQIDKRIWPFDSFIEGGNPKWFKVYSKCKHDKYELIKRWNLKYSLMALGGLLILVMTFPNIRGDIAVPYLTIEPKIFYLPGRRDLGKGVVMP